MQESLEQRLSATFTLHTTACCLQYNGDLQALDVGNRSLHAGVVRAMLVADVHHAIQGVLSAAHRRIVAFDAEVRPRYAGFMHAALTADVHHIVPSMLPAVHRRLVALNITARVPRAGVV